MASPNAAYFANDFTLAEIKTLGAVQANSGRPQQYNGLYKIPTLDEVIALAQAEGSKAGRTIGIYPEIKHSTFMAAIFGTNVVEDALIAKLHAAFGNRSDAPVFIQSFEVTNLQYLNTKDFVVKGDQKGLMVHTWTYRNDASGYGFSDPKAEMQYYMKLGVDGVFTDFPVTGVQAVAGFR